MQQHSQNSVDPQSFLIVPPKTFEDLKVGDVTLYTSLEVAELTTQDDKGWVTMTITIVNHDGDLVLAGKQHFILKRTA